MKISTKVTAGLLAGATLLAAASPAEAQYRYRYHNRGDRTALAIGAGALGLAVGAAVASGGAASPAVAGGVAGSAGRWRKNERIELTGATGAGAAIDVSAAGGGKWSRMKAFACSSSLKCSVVLLGTCSIWPRMRWSGP